MRSFSGRLVTPIIFIALFAGVVVTQLVWDQQKPAPLPYAFTHYPSTALKIADLGLNSATASLLWVNLIQEVGGMDVSRISGIDTMAQAIQMINAVDPKFSYPYAFATLLIPAFDPTQTPVAINIGKQGIAAGANDWRIPYYMGVIYHIQYRDHDTAQQYFTMTAQTPGVPANIRLFALGYATTTSARKQTEDMWTATYNSSNDDIVRDQAKVNLEHLEIMDILDQAIHAYKARKGVYPKEVQDLVSAGYINQMPVDPLGATFSIGENGALLQSVSQ